MKLGYELATLTAGIDRLYRSTPRSDGFLDREGLIPVAVTGVEPPPLRDYDEADVALEALAARLPAEAENALRQAYLAEMIDSLRALVTTFEERQISYAERLRRQIRVDTQLVGAEVLDGYRMIIRDRLDALGYRGGDLATDLGRWESDVRVPRDKVLETIRSYAEEARRRVSRLMFEMGHEWLEPVELSDVPFSAYCDYPGRKLMLNLDHPYSTHELKHLACHEAFPGHLVHLALRQFYVTSGKMPLDGAQVVTSSASSALFEGIADNGIYFLDWINEPAEELASALQRLRAALRCNAAWMLHAEQKSPGEVAEVISKASYRSLEHTSSSLAFLRHGLRAPFVYSYWCGDMAVYDVWKTVPAERRKDFWAYLYGNMHTPSTLRNFWH